MFNNPPSPSAQQMLPLRPSKQQGAMGRRKVCLVEWVLWMLKGIRWTTELPRKLFESIRYNVSTKVRY